MMTLADIGWLRSRFPQTYSLIREDLERKLACTPLEGSRVITLHSGTKVEVRGGKVAVVPS
jgi:hypothetical protein